MMPKSLTERQIARLHQGTHRCAPSLYIQIRGGSRLWIYRYLLAGKARSLSLGSLDTVTLDEAIAAAAAARVRVRRDGVDVVPERRAERTAEVVKLAEARALEPVPLRKSGHTFGEAIDVAAQEESRNWKPHPDAIAKWTGPIKKYCGALVSKDVTQVREADVIECLLPYWTTSHQTALRTLGRVVCIMGHARRLGWIAGDNPIVQERAKEKLPRVTKTKARHHPAMPLRAVPDFVKGLRANPNPMAQFFEFLILAGTRCNEAAGARWSEFDLKEKLWIIPGGHAVSRLKRWQHGDFRVPLSDGMLAILQARQAAREADEDDADPLVFPAPKARAWTALQVTKLLRDAGFAKGVASVHGMRSTLRQFLAEHCEGERVAKELCLAHETREDTEAAYDRGDYLRERRGMMAAWGAYCGGRVSLDTAGAGATVLPLRHAIAA
ncbi:tyrosine-type recombinase/integrase [Cupriavidus oxalaticus]|uniref:Site-specific integrase n=1 Tax=Cupriavidus oxalaticus TaxID=96344 RepID=A0A5P3VKB2_9BURK|nr:site-specific integrase [Cupriavidus oxalaticus]QEZ45691.1 site-specific integrase [Cupriavidus oxalaticus]